MIHKGSEKLEWIRFSWTKTLIRRNVYEKEGGTYMANPHFPTSRYLFTESKRALRCARAALGCPSVMRQRHCQRVVRLAGFRGFRLSSPEIIDAHHKLNFGIAKIILMGVLENLQDVRVARQGIDPLKSDDQFGEKED